MKQSLVDYHRSTNYSVVDMDLIQALYSTMYREKVTATRGCRCSTSPASATSRRAPTA